MEVNHNFSWKTEKGRNNSPLLPEDIRGLIVGKSNCGKTTLILNLLLNPGWLDYNHLFVFGKSLHQKEYIILKKGLESGLSKGQISNLFQNQDSISSPIQLIDGYIANGGVVDGGIKAEFYDDCKLIPDPSSLDEQEKNLMIFDDCILEKQSKAQSYYTRGRHSNCDCFYISQNYFKLDRQTIRENSNLIILFPQNSKNLNHIHADYCSEISIEQFKNFCNLVWSKKYNFVTLDLTGKRKYRENLDRFWNPTTMSFEDEKDADRLVTEYAEMVKRIRVRNENEKTKNLHRQEDLKETFEPIIRATEKQTEELKKTEDTLDNWTGVDILDFYFNHYPEIKRDGKYGIRKVDDKLMMGEQEVIVNNNNINVEGEWYNGTNELWALIMEKSPNVNLIPRDIMNTYLNLVERTGVADYVETKYKNYRALRKYEILEEITKHMGKGISFLPSDINSLADRLNLLLAEFNAGNGATRNEIVAIVDNLLERKKLSRAEAKEINSYLQNVGN